MRSDSLHDRMGKRWWCVILALAWIIHDSEELLLVPQMLRFMQSEAPGFLRDAYAGITVSELRAVLVILTTALLTVIAIAAVFARTTAAALGIIVLAALLGLNAVFHIALFIQTGVYAAGLATAVVISLPVAAALLVQARRERWVARVAFWAAVPTAFLVHGPVLDALFSAGLRSVR